MSMIKLSKSDLNTIEKSVALFSEKKPLFESFAQALSAYFKNDPRLGPLIHFQKHRIKDPDHLRSKLIRKAQQLPDGTIDVIGPDSLFQRVPDLAGIRLVHLHTEQMKEIHSAILDILAEQKLELLEDPQANCWDVEYEQLFEGFGIKARARESMYTTVHYVIAANQKTKISCELQVRTLMDEVWGEVSHKVNYPEATKNLSCIDQLKVLARLTSGCTRLVDSIFKSRGQS